MEKAKPVLPATSLASSPAGTSGVVSRCTVEVTGVPVSAPAPAQPIDASGGATARTSGHAMERRKERIEELPVERADTRREPAFSSQCAKPTASSASRGILQRDRPREAIG